MERLLWMLAWASFAMGMLSALLSFPNLYLTLPLFFGALASLATFGWMAEVLLNVRAIANSALQQTQSQMRGYRASNYAVDDPVCHPEFGDGIVVSEVGAGQVLVRFGSGHQSVSTEELRKLP